jgi:hypothetical protein
MNPAPAYASAERTAWPKSLKARCIWHEPSLIRNKTVGLSEWNPLDILTDPSLDMTPGDSPTRPYNPSPPMRLGFINV